MGDELLLRFTPEKCAGSKSCSALCAADLCLFKQQLSVMVRRQLYANQAPETLHLMRVLHDQDQV